ncbi:hypothetical protein J6590_036096 [Homalodisca vitripennis]|nr:hypothetical protein J6590_036096 [Homalodisca vitripennis]
MTPLWRDRADSVYMWKFRFRFNPDSSQFQDAIKKFVAASEEKKPQKKGRTLTFTNDKSRRRSWAVGRGGGHTTAPNSYCRVSRVRKYTGVTRYFRVHAQELVIHVAGRTTAPNSYCRVSRVRKYTGVTRYFRVLDVSGTCNSCGRSNYSAQLVL